MIHYPIFVYGTLMTGERAYPLFAAASVRHLAARLPNARLYSTGSYPIAVDCEQRASGEEPAIWGEVHWLTAERYTTLLAELDTYEGDEYRRLLRPVELVGAEAGHEQDAHRLEAWVYLGDGAYAAQYPIIAAGNWRKRADHVSN